MQKTNKNAEWRDWPAGDQHAKRYTRFEGIDRHICHRRVIGSTVMNVTLTSRTAPCRGCQFKLFSYSVDAAIVQSPAAVRKWRRLSTSANTSCSEGTAVDIKEYRFVVRTGNNFFFLFPPFPSSPFLSFSSLFFSAPIPLETSRSSDVNKPARYKLRPWVARPRPRTWASRSRLR